MTIVTDLDGDIDFNPIFQAYKVMTEASQEQFKLFIKEHPKWIVVPLHLPQLQERFLPQDLANLYTLLCIWLDEQCKARWQIFLGCLLFESRDDSLNFHQLWMVTKGTA